jgi:ribonuclease HI
MSKEKLYIVIKGKVPGIYKTWDECKEQVIGFSMPIYKSFKKSDLDNSNIKEEDKKYLDVYNGGEIPIEEIGDPILDSICVDGACAGNPGLGEYRCVDTKTGEVIFSHSQFEYTTNNIMEFLALTEAVQYTLKTNSKKPIYTDSLTAMSWVKNKKCKTNLIKNNQNIDSYLLIESSEQFLNEVDLSRVKILKWDTQNWGEIPADFGRK